MERGGGHKKGGVSRKGEIAGRHVLRMFQREEPDRYADDK